MYDLMLVWKLDLPKVLNKNPYKEKKRLFHRLLDKGVEAEVFNEALRQ